MTAETSIVLPVFNGEGFIQGSIEELLAFLQSNLPNSEVIIVNDGSTDRTSEILSKMNLPTLRVISYQQNRGKYGALKAGFGASHSPIRMFLDSDLPFDLRVIPYAAELIRKGFHLAVGDRTLAESETTQHRPLARRMASWAAATLIRQLYTGGIFDTQCGFKALNGTVAEEIFRLIRTDAFAGDAELLYIALKYNLAIRRIPVRFVRENPSSVQLIRDSLIMARQVLSIPVRWHTNQYQSSVLTNLGSQRYWPENPGS